MQSRLSKLVTHSSRNFARKTDPMVVFQEAHDFMYEDHMRSHWDPYNEHVEDVKFTEYAQVPPHTFKADVDVMERAKEFYLDRGIHDSARYSN